MPHPDFQIDRQAIAAFCRRNHIRRLSSYGSAVRDDFRADSDVDVLVEFQPDCVVGLRIIQMGQELSALLGGHKVDMVSREYLNHRIRDRVLASAEVLFADGACD